MSSKDSHASKERSEREQVTTLTFPSVVAQDEKLMQIGNREVKQKHYVARDNKYYESFN